MVKREHYLRIIREFYDSDLIKIITGIRRCGKSIILKQIMEEISTKTSNVIYLNLEDRETYNKIKDIDGLIEYVNKNRQSGLCYVFLDEIQMLDNWQEAVKTLRLKANSIFITGSNSKLLSKEFTKYLSGRYVAFRIRPFVYKEIVQYSKELRKKCTIEDYLIYGGFPKRFEFNSKDAMLTYLNDLDETIVKNDLINRYKIRNIDLFSALSDFILKSNSRIYSINSIKNYLNKENSKCSINTIIKYISYLEEAYIIESINQYSTKTKRDLAFYKKIYDEDVSFNTIRTINERYDLTHNLENIVYNELVYMGYSIRVYNVMDKEIDFMAYKNGKEYLIQVAYSLADDKTYKREFEVFNRIDNSRQKIIISNDNIDFSTSQVRHICLSDFLMMESLE